MKILNTFWFDCGGIVRVKTDHDGIKYYIKGLHPMINEKMDAQTIADWGNIFPSDAGDKLFNIEVNSHK